ncbi:MAG: hypothetical protein H7A33_06845 [Deltaproteobacteria bacterium]|nr:hypothetical protein [Deltaproteobacteria bacterium]
MMIQIFVTVIMLCNDLEIYPLGLVSEVAYDEQRWGLENCNYGVLSDSSRRSGISKKTLKTNFPLPLSMRTESKQPPRCV